MKSLLINLILCTFLISCATYPKTYVSEKQYYDEYVNKSCWWIKQKQITDKGQLEAITETPQHKKAVATEIMVMPLIILNPLIFFDATSNRSGGDDTYLEICNLKIELRMLDKIAKEKNCPREINYEIITDKSHSSHLPH